MFPVVLMARNLVRAVRYAIREEHFGPALGAALSLIAVGTATYAIGAGWNIIDALYFAVSTLTTTNVNDPALVLTDRSLKLFTIFYQLVGIGIVVEILRRLGSAYVAVKATPPPADPRAT